MRRLTLIILTVLFAAGCRETYIEEVDFPAVSKLAVASFITPGDTLLKVQITRSQPVYQRTNFNPPPISDAEVNISGNGQLINLTFNPTSKVYEAVVSSTFIAEGETYILRVKQNNESVEAKTTVPNRFVLQASALVTRLVRSDPFGSSRTFYGCQFNFSGNPAAPAFYGVSYQLVTRNNGIENLGSFYSNETFSLTKMDYYKSDMAQDAVQTILREVVNYSVPGNVSSKYFKIHLWQADEAFYQFNRTADMNYRSYDEFFSEPVPVYSNISGGLGCFGSYIRYTFNSPDF